MTVMDDFEVHLDAALELLRQLVTELSHMTTGKQILLDTKVQGTWKYSSMPRAGQVIIQEN
jgi:hypothetical protein